MAVYLSMLAVSLFFAVYAQRAKPYEQIRSSYITFCVLTALPFILVTVFRYRVGRDWTLIYEPQFYQTTQGHAGFAEPLFNLIYRFFALFTDEAWWPIAFVGLLTMIFFFAGICQQSCMIPYSVLLFFISNRFFNSLTALRQMLAMSIFFYSIKYIRERNWKRYYFFNLIAILLHTSSIMYLPAYFLYGVRATPKRCISLLVGTVVSFPLLAVLFRLVLRLTRFRSYLGGRYDAGNFDLMGFAVTFFFTVMHIFYLARFHDDDKDYEWMTYMSMISLVMYLFSSVIPQIVRAAEGFSVVQLLSIPLMLKKEDDDRMRVLSTAVVIGIFFVRSYLFEILRSGWYSVFPYRTIFSR